ncbi:carboxylesterase [Oceanobacillus oncorhynchi subsp. incaldanensis]|uniref:Alpha/beta hydrolase n=2 Tax=Oceanobacillus TaxID=182709 RepID=A0ABV9JY87_9BACI|nr:alpha/beta hydrolase [Oceanobacillus oncorhynchi]MDM8100328.1 alpha/beta hydrolase [Oceanobacillus oncorhynchi]UUI40858.1 alpha/beta hydrolase [Oceanobacillus oncorhynchi]GIO18723.1 carboxylesterase [Oceanobacillus oncorhynchi subsp. incaldanensis]CEI82297.1 Putative hydrolase MhqD [Oceanobacillus oncorhynchi]
MKYIYEEKAGPTGPTLLLLHGTGGTENDLLPLANIIDSEANVLSVRGNVLENGMPRFFRRLEEGVFDEEDLIKRTEELHDFLNEASQKEGFDRKQVTAIGYSNGANIAGSLLFHYKDSLQKAILHHPMVPRKGIDLPDLTGTDVFIAAGNNDPMCPPEEAEELQRLLANAGAKADIHWESNGHQLTMSEVKAAASWYAK